MEPSGMILAITFCSFNISIIQKVLKIGRNAMFDLSQAFNRFRESRIVALALVMFLHGSFTWAQEARTLAKPGEAIERMVRDVDAVSRLLQGRWVKNWVAEVGHLQPIEPKKIVVVKKKSMWMSPIITWGDMDPL